ncbi:MAG: acyl carrier protein [Planctomycetaceae bacterium]
MENAGPFRAADSPSRTTRSAAEIQDWLVAHLASELKITPDRINVDQSILAHGIDSMHVVAVVAQLEDWLGVRFSSDPLEDHPSIVELSESLARLVAGRTPVD